MHNNKLSCLAEQRDKSAEVHEELRFDFDMIHDALLKVRPVYGKSYCLAVSTHQYDIPGPFSSINPFETCSAVRMLIETVGQDGRYARN